MSLVIGLTGGIGSGKSAVARLMAERGARVVDADQLAREAVALDSPGLEKIRESFGGGVLAPDGSLDRARMGEIVFADPEARRRLESIVHPEVARLAMERIAALREDGASIIVYDVPLLYENGLESAFELVVVVDAPDDVRIDRIAARDDLPRGQIVARIEAQMPLSEKVERADYVIDNGGALDDTRQRVAALFEELARRDSSEAETP